MEDIIDLLRFVLTTIYFMFDGKIYQQKFGAAMGSPVSLIVAIKPVYGGSRGESKQVSP